MADEAPSLVHGENPSDNFSTAQQQQQQQQQQAQEGNEVREEQQGQPLRPGSYGLREGGGGGAGGSAAAAASGSGAGREQQQQQQQQLLLQRGIGSGQELRKPSIDTDAFRQQIHGELKRSGAFDRIRAMVLAHARGKAEERGTLTTQSSSSPPPSGGLMAQQSADLDVLRHILAEVTDGAATSDHAVERLGLPRSDHHYLQVDVYGAKAFTMSLLALASEGGGGGGAGSGGAPRLQSVVILHLHFKGQRSMSLPVELCAEPSFDESVLFDLGPAGPGPPAHEYMDILSQAEPLQMALMR